MVREWEKVAKRLPSRDGGKRCEFGVSVMKERGRIADSGVSATEKSQRCGTVVVQHQKQVKSVERWVFQLSKC
jgi:hypothetical protein